MSGSFNFSSGETPVVGSSPNSWSATPPSQSSSPLPADQTEGLGSRPAFIEQLGLQFSLNEDQVSILHGLYHVRCMISSLLIIFYIGIPWSLGPRCLVTSARQTSWQECSLLHANILWNNGSFLLFATPHSHIAPHRTLKLTLKVLSMSLPFVLTSRSS